MTDAKDEKRSTPRIQPFVHPCRIAHGSRRLSGYLADLSLKGAQVSCDAEPPPAGASIVIEVRFARRSGYSRLPAEVKWVRPGASAGEAGSLGVTFEDVSGDEQRVLESVVEEFRRRASLLA